MDPIGFSSHDHAHCITGNLAQIEMQCAKNGLQLTPVRKRVLEILLEEHRALGAYDILDKLRSEGLGSQPPIAYRALEFLVNNGFAHKIERMNAFVACAHPGQKHMPAFLICRKCQLVAEAETEPAGGALGSSAKQAGFQIERAVVEVEGVCSKCAKGDAT